MESKFKVGDIVIPKESCFSCPDYVTLPIKGNSYEITDIFDGRESEKWFCLKGTFRRCGGELMKSSEVQFRIEDFELSEKYKVIEYVLQGEKNE